MSITNVEVIERVREIAGRVALPFRTTCPVCKGGTSNERTLSVYNGEHGVMATCHRGTCSLHTITIVPHVRSTALAQARASVTHEREPQFDELPELQYHDNSELPEVLRKRYLPSVVSVLLTYVPTSQLKLATSIYGGWDALVFPQTDVLHYPRRGVLMRRLDANVRVKARTYALPPVPGTPDMEPWTRMGLYRGTDSLSQGHIVCVEDVVSAMVLATIGYNACCLNGTLVSYERWRALRNSGMGTKLLLLLDADATREALRHSIRLDPTVVRCARLTTDIKDMPVDETEDFMRRVFLSV